MKEATQPKKYTRIAKVPTGIPGFDLIANGGLPSGGMTLLSGTPGSAKTVFAAQFLSEGIRQFQEPGVFVTFEERPERMCQFLMSLGWDISAWEENGLWTFVDASPYTDGPQIETGSFNLEGLLFRIEHAIKESGARRVAMDSLGTMFSQVSDQSILRSELFRITLALQNLGVTSIITAERDHESASIDRYGVEEYVADNVVILRNILEEERRRRTVEILKFRGTPHQKGEFPFTVLDEKGIIVIPLSAMSLKQASSDQRTTCGNAVLDSMCGGGLLRNSVILISGATGTGKTLTVTQFIGGSQKDDRCLLFAFEESREQIIRNAAGWGFDFAALEAEGRLKIVCAYPEVAGLDDHLVSMKLEMENFQPHRVVVDSLSALERISTPKSFRELVISLTSFVKEKNYLTAFTSTTPALMGGTSITEAHISTITDTIVLLRYVEILGEMRRGIMVLKMRGSIHEKQIREFKITSQGMQIERPFKHVAGILSGNPSLVIQSDEMSRVGAMFSEDEESDTR